MVTNIHLDHEGSSGRGGTSNLAREGSRVGATEAKRLELEGKMGGEEEEGAPLGMGTEEEGAEGLEDLCLDFFFLTGSH